MRTGEYHCISQQARYVMFDRAAKLESKLESKLKVFRRRSCSQKALEGEKWICGNLNTRLSSPR